MRVTLDFESASDVDLAEVGAWAYWEHPTTEVLCLCAITDEGWQFTWLPGEDACRLRAWASDPSVIFEAHNAAFEQAAWELYMHRVLGLPRIPIERWDCTMARAYYRGLPGGLDQLSAVLRLDEQKDTEGRALTLSLSKPMTQVAWALQKPEGITMAAWKRRFAPGTYDRSRATLGRVVQYCMQDCRTEIAVSRAVGPLSPYERRVWEIDQRMNQRGLLIDREYIKQSQKIVADASKPLIAEFEKITGGLAPTQTAKLLAWCNGQGFKIETLAKDHLKTLGIAGLDDDDADGFSEPDARPGGEVLDMPEQVKRVLGIRAVLGSASIKKLGRMLECANGDGRIRNSVQYHGAGTGRWAGRLFQPQNFPRGKIEGGHDPDELVAAIATGDYRYVECLFGDPVAAVASGLRHAIVGADGHLLLAGDFAGIEARVVLALAGQHDKCELMASGADVYLDMARSIYRRPVSKDEKEKRQAGKAAILGCGFQMGWERFVGSAKTQFGVTLTPEQAQDTVNAYRKVWAPKVPELWAALQQASYEAVYDGTPKDAYGIVYKLDGKWLGCHLPDGQIMWYYDPQLTTKPMPWDHTDIRPCWSYKAMKNGQWKTIYAYGGLQTENVVQKLARGLLCEAMARLEREGYPLVLTVHDECVSEVPEPRADKEAYMQIMAEPTRLSRAIGVPIAVEGWVGGRYKK